MTFCYHVASLAVLKIPSSPNCISGSSTSDYRRFLCTLQAARNGSEEQVARLLALKAHVNHTDKKGLTALHYAVQYRCEGIIKILILNGAGEH